MVNLLAKSRALVGAVMFPALIANGLLAPLLLTATLFARSQVPVHPGKGFIDAVELTVHSILESMPLELLIPAAMIACATWLTIKIVQVLITVEERGANYETPKDTAIHGMCAALWAWPAYFLLDYYQVGYASTNIAACIIGIGLFAFVAGLLCDYHKSPHS